MSKPNVIDPGDIIEHDGVEYVAVEAGAGEAGIGDSAHRCAFSCGADPWCPVEDDNEFYCDYECREDRKNLFFERIKP